MKYYLLLPLLISLFILPSCEESKESEGPKGLKEGVIVYDVDVGGGSISQLTLLKMVMPDEMFLSFKGNKYHTRLGKADSVDKKGNIKVSVSKSESIYHPDNGSQVTLQNIPGQGKYAVTRPSEKERENLNIEITGETKKIAGYTCKKAKLINKKTGDVSSLWFTNEIPVNTSHYQGLEGALMEYTEVSPNGIRISFRAEEVRSESIPSSLFEIPEDYKKVSAGEFKKINDTSEKGVSVEKKISL